MGETKSEDLTIRYDDLGQGEPALLCMSGWCASRRYYNELVRLLSVRCRVLALDWRGHGESDSSPHDFGVAELVRDAIAVIEASGARQVVPIAAAHAGWVAIELRRTLGAERIPEIVLIDWIVTDAPPPFVAALAAMQNPLQTASVRDQLFAAWTEGVEHPGVERFVRDDMGNAPLAMWSRAGREIAAAYAREGSPLAALASLSPPSPTLHLYAQPADPEFLRTQEQFTQGHPWFQVQRLRARSHFPALEVPDQLVGPIEGLVRAEHGD